MRKTVTTLLVSLMCLTSLLAQDEFNWKLRLGGGTLVYVGDLSYKLYPTADGYDPAFDVSLERRLNSTFGLRLSGGMGTLYGSDRLMSGGELVTVNPLLERQLNFKTDVRDASLMFTLNTNNGTLLSRRAFLSPYLFAGLGITNFDVFGDLFWGPNDQNRYHYWGDGTIRDIKESDAGPSQIIMLDGNYETNLTNLHTETDENYSTTVLHIPVGLGLNFRFSDRLSAQLAGTYKFVSTDYLDDVSGQYRANYPNIALEYIANPSGSENTWRGNENTRNDQYFYPSLSLTYQFGRVNSEVVRSATGPGVSISEEELKQLDDQVPPKNNNSTEEVVVLDDPNTTTIIKEDGKVEIVTMVPFDDDQPYQLVQREEEIYMTDENGYVDTVTIVKIDTVWNPDYQKPVVNNNNQGTGQNNTGGTGQVSTTDQNAPLNLIYEQLKAIRGELTDLRRKNEDLRAALALAETRPATNTSVGNTSASELDFIVNTLIKETVFFGLNQSTLDAVHRYRLERVVSLLQRHQGLGVNVIGHTDRSGSPESNMRLSERRALSVSGYLLSRPTILQQQVRSSFVGEVQTLSGTTTRSSNPVDRRVEVEFYKLR